MAFKKTNIEVWYDRTSDSDEQGWVVRWDETTEHGEIVRTAIDAPLDAETAEEAVREAMAYLDVDPEDVTLANDYTTQKAAR